MEGEEVEVIWRLAIILVLAGICTGEPTPQYDDIVVAKYNEFAKETNLWAEIKRNTNTMVKRGKPEKETFERMKVKFEELRVAVESLE